MVNKRLAVLERLMAEKLTSKRMSDCICKNYETDITIVVSNNIGAFEAEMNRECPVHGLRRLGKILPVVFESVDGNPSEETLKLDQLLAALRSAPIGKA